MPDQMEGLPEVAGGSDADAEPREGAQDALVGATLETLRRAVEDVEGQRSVAEALQHYLLPDHLPQIVGLHLAARYIPGGAKGPVGGDWYDAVPLRSGGAGVVIGDIVGHGVTAAARMARLQSALRAYALEGRMPGESLGLMNAFVREDDDIGMATVLSAVVDPEAYTLRFASAGHLAPLAIPPDGEPTYLGTPTGNPLGVVEFPVYEEVTAPIGPSTALVLFTDGLVERREGSLARGLEALVEVARGWGGDDPDQLCELLLEGMLGSEPPRDDVAVLVVHVLPGPGPDMEMRLLAVPDSLNRARRELGRWLRAMGADDTECYELLVAAGEACANAVAHAYSADQDGWLDLSARCADGGSVTITVQDYGQWRLPRRQPSRGMFIMRELSHEVEVERGAQGTIVRIMRRLRRGGDDD